MRKLYRIWSFPVLAAAVALLGLLARAQAEPVVPPAKSLKAEETAILLPVNSRKDAVQLFHVIEIMSDQRNGFSHSIIWMAACHALHAHQPHTLPVQIKPSITYIYAAHSKLRLIAMQGRTLLRQANLDSIEVRMVEVPQSRPGDQNRLKDYLLHLT